MNDRGDCKTAPATPDLLISNEGDCRTAPATPGLLTTSFWMKNFKRTIEDFVCINTFKHFLILFIFVFGY